MIRIPYEIVAFEAERIIVKMAFSNNWDQAIYYWDQYNSYIEACGWTSIEFDKETLRRIDAAWVSVKRNRN